MRMKRNIAFPWHAVEIQSVSCHKAVKCSWLQDEVKLQREPVILQALLPNILLSEGSRPGYPRRSTFDARSLAGHRPGSWLKVEIVRNKIILLKLNNLNLIFY